MNEDCTNTYKIRVCRLETIFLVLNNTRSRIKKEKKKDELRLRNRKYLYLCIY